MSNQQRTQTQARTQQQSPLKGPNKGPDQPPATVNPEQPNGNGKAQSAEERVIEYTPLGESVSIKLTIDMVRKFLCVPTKQGHWPDDATIIKYMMVCRQRKLNPWVGDCYLLGYDTKNGPKFSIVVAVQALFKRAEISDQFDGIESGVVVIGKDDEIIERQGDLVFRGEQLVGGWAAVYRKDRSKPFYQRLALSTYRKDTPQWQSDGAGMIVKCFDEQTEVLTLNGFRRFADVDSPIMQVTDAGLEPVNATPFVQNYSGDMIVLDSDDLNFSVTPNHDMVLIGGRTEARDMFDRARSRATMWIPRIATERTSEAQISDDAIMLSAIYLADGYDGKNNHFSVSVSKQRKLDMIRSIGGFASQYTKHCEGVESRSSRSDRVIAGTADQTCFAFNYSVLGGMVAKGKVIDLQLLSSLSRRQARMFVDTLLSCDGARNSRTGVRRFYQSNLPVMDAFELAAVIGGYSVSNRTSRTSDISTKPNYCITVSTRDLMGVRRWGRHYRYSRNSDRHHPGLEIVQNQTGRVWCVTVPSGTIIVRRNGFSMQCGNCCESGGLRQAFPSDIGGLYLEQEIHEMQSQETVVADKPRSESTAAQIKERLAGQVVGKAATSEQEPDTASQTRQDAPGEHSQETAAEAEQDDAGPFDDESGSQEQENQEPAGTAEPAKQENIKF